MGHIGHFGSYIKGCKPICKERGFAHWVKLQITGVTPSFTPFMRLMTDVFEISSGPFVARILSTGATLGRFQYHDRDLILGFKNHTDHRDVQIYAGAIVGPVANRITDGRIMIGSKAHQMQRNENDKTTLHSGDSGLHARRWDVVSQHTDRIVLNCQLPDQENGLPGNRNITAEYRMTGDGLRLTITATTDHKTPINIAHHPYWVLDQNQAQTTLEIAAQHYLPVDAAGLPLGSIETVAQSPFDFRVSKPIGPASTLDHNYCLAQQRRDTPHPAARITATDGLTLDIETTEPGLQVYAGSGLPELDKNVTFGAISRPNAAIALEPQGWPDAPNNANFPSIFIGIGDVYQQITQYRISHSK